MVATDSRIVHILLMDTDTFGELKKGSKKGPLLAHAIDGFERYGQDNMPFETEFYNEADFDEFIALLGLQNIRSEAILAYHVYNDVSGNVRDSEGSDPTLPFQPESSIKTIFARIADAQSFWEDEINDYHATFLLKFNESTVIAFGEASVDDSQGENIDVTTSYWAGVFNRSDIDNYESWKNWELRFFDKKKHQAEVEAREIEREQAAGITNLSRLMAGDTLRVTMKHPEHTKGNTYGASHFSQDELAERPVSDFVILESGTEPLCGLRLKDDSLEQARLAGGGNWTTRGQNPVQDQDIAMTPWFGFVRQGNHILYRMPETGLAYSKMIIDSVEVISEES